MQNGANTPKRGYLGRGLLVVVGLAAVGLLAVAGGGYHWYGDVRLHVLLALVISLLLLFAHLWMLIYLSGTGRLIRKSVAAHGFDPNEDDLRRRAVRRARLWLPLAALGVLAAFLSGAVAMIRQGELYPRYWHHAIFFAALALQLAALWTARPALMETERRIRALDGRIGNAA